ncbi:MAG TPA: NADH-quinone oxidoreductase subunit N [Gemmatales bacterium]|nr:NADH-quinone oxidoreductase subunit N [Gemmatales bacterium]
MNQHFLTGESVTQLTQSLGGSLAVFAPELVLAGGIVLLLLLRMLSAFNRLHLGYVALGIGAVALWLSWTQWQPFLMADNSVQQSAFGGMLVFDGLTAFIRLFLMAGLVLLVWLTLMTGIPDREDSADFYVLLLGAVVGMNLMASANHLLMVFISIEMASLPSYGLVGFLKGRRQSSEAALKYVVYGGAAAGVMLYGMSFLVGRCGSGYLPDVALSFQALLRDGGFDPLLLVSILMILIGLAFKLSAVPFHFWCPDVFEGAAAEVGAFLSVASKGAAVALTGRFCLTLVAGTPADPVANAELWNSASHYFGPALAFFAAVTATFGNLAAYTQTNLKRLLAYSTIAHAGILIMGIAALTADGLSAALLYLVVYLFGNFGAFAVVALLRNAYGTEDLADYSGMVRRAPFLTVAMAIFLLSLVGLPPLMGYVAKFEIFAELYQAGYNLNRPHLIYLLIVGLFNTVISLFYYVKVLKVMIIEPLPEGAAVQPIAPLANIYVGLLAFVTTFGLLVWDPLMEHGAKRATAPMRFVAEQVPAAGPR